MYLVIDFHTCGLGPQSQTSEPLFIDDSMEGKRGKCGKAGTRTQFFLSASLLLSFSFSFLFNIYVFIFGCVRS